MCGGDREEVSRNKGFVELGAWFKMGSKYGRTVVEDSGSGGCEGCSTSAGGELRDG